MNEKDPLAERPTMKLEEIREFINPTDVPDELNDAYSDLRVMTGKELEALYTNEVLERSPSWHAFMGSGMEEGEEPLPDDVEKGINQVIANLIERKLKPILRS